MCLPFNYTSFNGHKSPTDSSESPSTILGSFTLQIFWCGKNLIFFVNFSDMYEYIIYEIFCMVIFSYLYFTVVVHLYKTRSFAL